MAEFRHTIEGLARRLYHDEWWVISYLDLAFAALETSRAGSARIAHGAGYEYPDVTERTAHDEE